MKSPFTGKDMKLVCEKRAWKFRGEAYEYTRRAWLCEDTGEQFTTDETDDVAYVNVTNQYRAKYGIPYVDEIVGIREAYGLSSAKMALILGMGVNQWRHYEDGEVPSVSNGRMIRSISNPNVFLEMVRSAKVQLSEREYNKLESRILDMCRKYQNDGYNRYDSSRIFMSPRGIENGFGRCSLDKLKNVMLWILEQCGNVFCTKMNKLLFYIDFLSYRNSGMSVTGLTYRALSYGPVPERWDRIYSQFDEILQEPRAIGDKEGIILVRQTDADMSWLTQAELEIIKVVCERFKDCSSSELSRLSHDEDAWQECISENKRIPFEYAFSLKAI